MTFVSTSKLAKEVKAKISDDRAVEKQALKQEVSLNAVVLSEVDKKWADLPTTNLQDLFHNGDSDPELSKKTTFRTSFCVTKVEPADVKEWVKSYDKKSGKAVSTKGGKAAGNLIYQVQFLVKDVST